MPNWYGETLFATPFVRALRAMAPGASISALGPARTQAMLERHPLIDRFILYDESGPQRGLPAAWRAASTIRAQRYDAAIVLRRSFTRTALLAAAGVPVRIGFANAKSGWLLTHPVRRPAGTRHKAEEYFALLAPLGEAPAPGPCDYYSSPEERAQASQLLRAAGIDDQRNFVVIHSGANWAHKRWPTDAFAELGARLMREASVAILLTGSADDAPLAGAIRARMAPHAPHELVGRTTIRQLAAVLERAAAVISNDTGVLHLAAALRRPVVALYGPTSPALTGPYGDPALTRVIHHPECCPAVPCYQPDHPGYPGMAAISVEEVVRAAKELLRHTADSTQHTEKTP
ncbi:MAG: lipopolysaccharide heptosyltransferase II [Candidatus Omnitrophica bacterium]|nr:lipopolysaccharide heptosyltransferase II [Candidatus Omnitrophota bacterium]